MLRILQQTNLFTSWLSRPLYSFASYNRPAIEPQERWRILLGDKVVLISGKDRGKSGIVSRVYRKLNRIQVKGLNVKFQRISAMADPEKGGGVREISKSIHVSKVQLADPESGKPTKVQVGFREDGQKIRISKRSGTVIEKHVFAAWKRQYRHKNKVDGLMDTPARSAIEVTYRGEDFAAIKAQFLAEMAEKERKERLMVFDE